MNKKILVILLITSIIVGFFSFHTIYIGADENRIVNTPEKIVEEKNFYFEDKDNTLFNTTIFVKKGFMIEESKKIFLIDFIPNNILLVPYYSIFNNNIFPNIYYFIISFFTSILIFKIIYLRTDDEEISILLTTLYNFSLVNFSLFTSFYPDSILIFFLCLAVYLYVKYKSEERNIALYVAFLAIAAYVVASKITIYFFLVPIGILILFKLRKPNLKKIIMFGSLFCLFFISFNGVQFIHNYDLYGNPLKFSSFYYEFPNPNSEKEFIEERTFFENFYLEFIKPKNSGMILLDHIFKDLNFLASYFQFGLLGVLYLLSSVLSKRDLEVLSLVGIFAISFFLWGNMNIYGGSSSFHLRNSHIRYMWPCFLLIFLFLATKVKTILSRKIILAITICTIAFSLSVLPGLYPFNLYSKVVDNNFINELNNERQQIKNLSINEESVVLSLLYDDYDLSYIFNRYGNLELIAKDIDLMIKKVSQIKKEEENVYLIVPKRISRFNNIKNSRNVELFLGELRNNNLTLETIYENNNKKIYLLK